MTNKNLRLETIDRFFQTLAAEWPHPTQILLIGGAVALIVGSNRTTEDIDFEATLDRGARWEDFEATLRKIEEGLKIRLQFSESIERWSMISFLDYTRHRVPYKRYGKINATFLKPSYWAIGKVSRYLDQDVQDMVLVFLKDKTDPVRLAKLWRRALDESPDSSQLFNVKKQMSHFFKTHGPGIWGKSLPLDKILPLFK